MIFRRYPRITMALLSAAFFLLGFWRERSVEHSRVQTLIESSIQANLALNQLVSAYNLQVVTVRDLVTYALRHKISPPSTLVSALDRLTQKGLADITEQVQVFQSQQSYLDSGARELIAVLDSELPEVDGEFLKLYREFEGQDKRLRKIQSSYDQQTRRVRELARKGDGKFLKAGIRIPGSSI